MMKVFQLFFLTLLGFSVVAQTPAKKESSAADKRHYRQAKREYLAFEKEHGGFVQTNNVRMHYLTWGNPKNSPLIWAHGSLTHSYELMEVAQQITAAGYYLIAIDQYGHGKTPFPVHETSLYHAADDIRVLMDTLKLKQAVIGGFSRGGFIAAAFYQSYPDRVRALVLEDGGSVAFNTYYHRMPEALLTEKILDSKLPLALDQLYNGNFATEQEAYESLYDPSAAGNQFEILSIVNKSSDHWITYQGLMPFFGMKDEKQFRSLITKPNSLDLYAGSITMVQPQIIFRNLAVPVLILDPVHVNDPMPFEKENIALAKKFPRLITRIEFQDVEHNVHHARPKEFCTAIIEFLNSIVQ
jgi:pimeloyl-ACP methyl ester carboxylesterase